MFLNVCVIFLNSVHFLSGHLLNLLPSQTLLLNLKILVTDVYFFPELSILLCNLLVLLLFLYMLDLLIILHKLIPSLLELCDIFITDNLADCFFSFLKILSLVLYFLVSFLFFRELHQLVEFSFFVLLMKLLIKSLNIL